MSLVTTPAEITRDSLPDAPDEEWFGNFLEFDNARGRQLVAAVNATRETALVDVDLVHGTSTPRANPLSVPIAGIYPVRCFGVNVDSTTLQPNGGFYSLGMPDIEWHPSTRNDGSVLVTATFPRTISGAIGEWVANSIVQASALTLGTNTAKTITSITLSPGDWDISLIANLDGALTGTAFAAAIGQTTDSMSGTIVGDTRADTPTVSTAGDDLSLVVPPARFSITATTPFYYVALAVFTAGTAKAYGRISARRMVDKYSIAAPRGRVRLLFIGEQS